MEVAFIVSLVGIACAIVGFVVGHLDGSAKWQAMYIEEQNKRVAAEATCSHLKRTGECLSDKIIQQQKLLEQFNQEAA